MLSKEDNERLTRVGPGTPMGNLFRQFWLPALLSTELAEPDCDPLQIRLLGEDLIAFRDTTGRVGIVEAYCAHRGANLFWGRNEQCGIRCIYHGWKYDVDGQCVDRPTDPPDKPAKAKVGIQAYPTLERAGVIWVYMGPTENKPLELPQFRWVTAAEGHQHVTKWIQRSNWLQGFEGELDPVHLSYLHRQLSGDAGAAFNPARAKLLGDGAPKIEVRPEEYGLSCGTRRQTDEDDLYYWRVTRFMLPSYSVVADTDSDAGGRCFVPIDDNHTWTFAYRVRDTPYTAAEDLSLRTEGVFPPRLERGRFTLPDGFIIDTDLPVASPENDFLIDRIKQRHVNFTGMITGNDEDRAIHETMRRIPDGSRISDRSKERLTTTDRAIALARRILLKTLDEMAQGINPTVAHSPSLYTSKALDVVSRHESLGELLDAFAPASPLPESLPVA